MWLMWTGSIQIVGFFQGLNTFCWRTLHNEFCTEKSRFSEAVKIKLACTLQDLKTVSPSLERNKEREKSSKLK